MARSRCLLHKNKLAEFQAWCEERGWKAEPMRGDYQVLRMRHERTREPMIVYTKNIAPEHLVVYGVGLQLARAFLNRPHHKAWLDGVASANVTASDSEVR